MTPEQADRLRELFFESREASRHAFFTATPESYAADDAAVAGFIAAVSECTSQESK